MGADPRWGVKIDPAINKQGAATKAGAIRNLLVAVDEVSARLRPSIDRAKGAASELFATLITLLDVYHDEQNLYDLRQRITDGVRHHPNWSHLEIVWDNLSLQLKAIEDKKPKPAK